MRKGKYGEKVLFVFSGFVGDFLFCLGLAFVLFLFFICVATYSIMSCFKWNGELFLPFIFYTVYTQI